MSDDRSVILCIDDDPDVLSYLQLVLETEGYEVVVSPTAEEGLQRYRERIPDLIIVDLMMEEVDSGTGFVRDLRLLGNTAPVYLLSSVGDNLATTVDTSSLGLDGVFQKPISREHLLAVLAAKLPRAGKATAG